MKISPLSIIFALMLLTACKAGGEVEVQNTLGTNDDAMMEDSAMEDDDAMDSTGSPQVMEDESMEDSEASYQNYSADVLANGETKVLFFHANWCPICKTADADLTAWYNSEDFARSVYKVDFDSATELRSRYGVVTQHTFVLVDGEGDAITTLSGPTDAQLQALLQG